MQDTMVSKATMVSKIDIIPLMKGNIFPFLPKYQAPQSWVGVVSKDLLINGPH